MGWWIMLIVSILSLAFLIINFPKFRRSLSTVDITSDKYLQKISKLLVKRSCSEGNLARLMADIAKQVIELNKEILFLESNPIKYFYHIESGAIEECLAQLRICTIILDSIQLKHYKINERKQSRSAA